MPQQNRIVPQTGPARTVPVPVYIRQAVTFRRPAIHEPVKRNNAASRQRGQTPDYAKNGFPFDVGEPF